MGNIYRLSQFYTFHRLQQKNYLILNQIYDIEAEFQNQDKQIILCKVAHTVIKGNEGVHKVIKKAIDMPKFYHIDYYLTNRRTRKFKWQREWENGTSKLHFIISCIE